MELNNLSDIFQSKLRLMLISALITGKKTFRELKEITGARSLVITFRTK